MSRMRTTKKVLCQTERTILSYPNIYGCFPRRKLNLKYRSFDVIDYESAKRNKERKKAKEREKRREILKDRWYTREQI